VSGVLLVLRHVGVWLLGVVVGGVTVALVEGAGHAVFPFPADLDPSDSAAVAAAMAEAPLGALLSVLAAWGCGAVVASFVGTALSSWRRVLMGAFSAGLVLVGTAANLILIPHPVWMTLAGPVVVLLGMTLGAWLGLRVPVLGGGQGG
jgi:hypothetical protein